MLSTALLSLLCVCTLLHSATAANLTRLRNDVVELKRLDDAALRAHDTTRSASLERKIADTQTDIKLIERNPPAVATGPAEAQARARALKLQLVSEQIGSGTLAR